MTIKDYYKLNKKQLFQIKKIFQEKGEFIHHTSLQEDERILLEMKVFIVNEDVVGFCYPHKNNFINEYKDFWRMVPLQIAEKHKRKGYAFEALKKIYKGKKGLVFIDHKNFASINLHIKLGFKICEDNKVNNEKILEEGSYWIKNI